VTFTASASALTPVGHLAVAHGDDLAFDRLLLRGVGDDDAPLGLLFFLHALDEHAVVERTNRHL
jgi:hypothetical protein